MNNRVGRSLQYAYDVVLDPLGGHSARSNVPKVVVVVLGSASLDAVGEAARRLVSHPYLVTVAVVTVTSIRY